MKYTLEDVRKKYLEKGYVLLSDKYTNNKTNLTFKDNEGYLYYQCFASLLSGRQPIWMSKTNPYVICNIKNYIKMHKINVELISESFEDVKHTKLKFKCKCGDTYECRWGEFHRDNQHKCKKCSSGIQWNVDLIKTYLIENKIKTKLISNEYKNVDSKLLWECNCGDRYECTLHHLLGVKQYKCKKCSKIEYAEKVKIPQEIVEKEFLSKGWKLLDKYEKTDKRVTCVNKDGYKSIISRDSMVTSNCNPEVFSKNNPYTFDNINLYLSINGSCNLIGGEYIDSNSKTLILRCECGEEFIASWSSILTNNKYRCDRCTKKQSNISYLVELYLKENGYSYKKEYRFNDCKNIKPLPFDFCVFKEDKICLIEVDGQQHFYASDFGGTCSKDELEQKLSYVKTNDNIKNNYCKENNINLIRIPFNAFKRKTNTYVQILERKLN